MADLPTDSTAELSDTAWHKVDRAVRRLEVSWQVGTVDDLSAFVPHADEPLRLRILAELIKVDQEYHWRNGQRRELEYYVSHWPELDNRLSLMIELVEAECLTRSVFDQPVTEVEIHDRFPLLAEQLDLEQIAKRTEQLLRPPDRRRSPGGAHASASEIAPLGIGRRLGRYEIRANLGSGGMGDVYLAFDQRLRREVALKIPRFIDTRIRERFLREPLSSAAIEHRNVCRIYDTGHVDGVPYIAMELIQGETLSRRAEERPFDESETVVIIEKVARALAHVHRAGVVHRDIKASNIMIDHDGEPVLMDFGLARVEEPMDHLTGTGSLLGTLAYMPPEQATGEGVDARSDIYSLGVVLFQLLTGELPFTGSLAEVMSKITKTGTAQPSNRRPGLSRDIDTICLTATARRLEDRYLSADRMADALSRYRTGQPQLASAPKPLARLWMWTTLSVVLLLSFGLAALFLRLPAAPAPSIIGINRWIETDPNIGGFAVSRDNSTVYVGYREDRDGTYIQMLDAASGRELETIEFEYQEAHTDLVLSKNQRYLYTTNYHKSHITRVDLNADNAKEDLPIGGSPGQEFSYTLAITPDEQSLVVSLGHDGNGGKEDLENDQISVVDIADGELRLVGEVKLDDEVAGRNIGISEDSQYAYVVTKPRNSEHSTLYEVHLRAPFEVTRRLSLAGSELRGVAISAHSDRLYLSDQSGKRVHVVDRASFRLVASWKLADYSPGTLLMDDKRDLLAVLCAKSRVALLLDATSGDIVARIEGLRRDCQDMELSSDGLRLYVATSREQPGIAEISLLSLEQIAFASDRDGEDYEIYTMRGDGTRITRLTDNHSTDLGPCWSPDGRQIAFLTDMRGRPNICLINPDGSGLKALERTDPALISNGTGRTLAWAPDARRIAFISRDSQDRRNLKAVDPQNGRVETLWEGNLRPPYSYYQQLDWAPDGTLVLSAEDPNNGYTRDLFRLNVDTRDIDQITDDRGRVANTHAPAVSPDSHQIVALRQLQKDKPVSAGVFLLGSVGGQWTKLTPNSTDEPHSPRWSSDGRRIVFSTASHGFRHLELLGVASGEVVSITGGDWNDIDPDLNKRVAVPFP